MKKLLIVASTLSCLFISLPVYAESAWVDLVTTKLGDRIMVDRNSVKVTNRGRLRQVSFIVKTLYSTPEPDGTVKTAARYNADCLSDSLSVEWFTKYDDGNQILSDNNNSSGFVPVRSGSVGEALYEYSCQYLR